MPLGLEELNTGHYVLFVVVFRSSNYIMRRFHHDEKVALRMKAHLERHAQTHMCLASLIWEVVMKREVA